MRPTVLSEAAFTDKCITAFSAADRPSYLPIFLRSGAFSALKEGQSWHDPATRLLLSFESLGGCPGTPALPLYNHSGGLLWLVKIMPPHAQPTKLPACSYGSALLPCVCLHLRIPDPACTLLLCAAHDFYGFRGEWPQQESFERADYTGERAD